MSNLRALIVPMHSNFIELYDADCLKRGIEKVGFKVDLIPLKELDLKIDSINVKDYDIVIVWPSFSAIFVSGGNRRTTMQKLIQGARPGAIHMVACDVNQSFTPYMWNKGENSKEHRVNVFEGVPVTVIGSFDKAIYDDEKAMERANFLWMRKLAEGSQFKAVEWLLFHGGESEKRLKAEMDAGADFDGDHVRKFYYGLGKAKVAKSLKTMGFGEDPDDATFGGMDKYFPNLRNLQKKPPKRGIVTSSPEFWAPIARASDEVCFPYEPIKGEYQVTKRVMEYACIGNPNVQWDDRVAKRIREFIDPRIWQPEAERVAEEIRDMTIELNS